MSNMHKKLDAQRLSDLAQDPAEHRGLHRECATFEPSERCSMISQSDRELLELAAKAAGLRIKYWAADNYPIVLDKDQRGYGWNPLVFDGDALRLVVRLDMGVVIDKATKRAAANVGTGDYLLEPFGDDQFAATRRAIVRAAAEIGAQILKQEGGSV